MGFPIARNSSNPIFNLHSSISNLSDTSRAMSTMRIGDAGVSTRTDWRVWVPCFGMALCSWLAFVDRQVLAILSPTILQDTGLTPQDFTNAFSFFFVAYTVANPLWGSVLDYV